MASYTLVKYYKAKLLGLALLWPSFAEVISLGLVVFCQSYYWANILANFNGLFLLLG